MRALREKGGRMANMGPEERERFARREEGATSVSHREIEPERQRAIKVVAGGSVVEGLCGAATVVLAILGLADMWPGYMASIATITFGVALLAQGGTLAARYSRLLREATPYEWDSRTESGGMGAEFLAGGAGVVLGILGILGIGTATLIPIAVIVFGAALLLGSSAAVDVGTLGGANERFTHAVRQATTAASGAQVLVGISAIVLGIIALVGVETVAVTLVALLVIGASVLFSGAAISSRVASVMRRF
jgi:hypothetical protein